MLSILVAKCESVFAKLLEKRGFLGGVALSSPFYAEFFPWSWTVVLVGPLVLSVILRPKKNQDVSAFDPTNGSLVDDPCRCYFFW